MRESVASALLLALLCLVSAGCATLARTGPGERAGPRPEAAIALSVLSESIYLVDPATGRTAEVVGGLIDFQSGYAAWAPDHRRLAFGNHGIYALDFVRHEQQTLARGARLSMPAWNARGDRIVYGDGVSMWLARTGPTPAPMLLHLPARLAALGMDWGQNGRIVFEGLARECHPAPRCHSTARSEIWVVDPGTFAARQLTHVGHAESPRWSPDGSKILFIRRAATDHRRELWVVNGDGSDARRLSSRQNVIAADWSPDGLRLAVVTAPTPTTLQVWLADADGSNLRALGAPIDGTEATVDW